MPPSSSIATSLRSPPPPYSGDLEQGATDETRPLFSGSNTRYVPTTNPSPDQHKCTSKWFKFSKRAIAICVFGLVVALCYIYSPAGEPEGLEERHQRILDGLAWADLAPSEGCLRFGTREYSAQLMGLPRGENGLQFCREKEVYIHGVVIEKPEYCTLGGLDPNKPRVYGHWQVDWDEPSCEYNLGWAELTPSERCLRFGTREYSAQLMGVPSGEDGLRFCRETEITIHDVDINTPLYCTLDASDPNNPRIHGHWTVSWNEPSCKTLWQNFQDEGCVATGSGARRIEAFMGNHQPPWDNWREMCSTTPADYGGHHFDEPHSCDNRGPGWGIWGIWLLPDGSC